MQMASSLYVTDLEEKHVSSMQNDMDLAIFHPFNWIQKGTSGLKTEKLSYSISKTTFKTVARVNVSWT